MLREFGSTYLGVAFDDDDDDDDDLFKYQYYFYLRRNLCFRAAVFLLYEGTYCCLTVWTLVKLPNIYFLTEAIVRSESHISCPFYPTSTHGNLPYFETLWYSLVMSTLLQQIHLNFDLKCYTVAAWHTQRALNRPEWFGRTAQPSRRYEPSLCQVGNWMKAVHSVGGAVTTHRFLQLYNNY